MARSGEANDLHRLGAIWRISNTPVLTRFFSRISMFYMVAVQGYQFDSVAEPGWRWQLGHVYRIGLFARSRGDRAYLAGFMDHNLWVGGDETRPWASRIVTEHQLGVRVVGGLHVVAEYPFADVDSRPGAGRLSALRSSAWIGPKLFALCATGIDLDQR